MKTIWICRECGYVYDGEDYNQETKEYTCPLCERGKEVFDEREYECEVEKALEEAIKAQSN